MQLPSKRPPVWLRVEGNSVDDSSICVTWPSIAWVLRPRQLTWPKLQNLPHSF